MGSGLGASGQDGVRIRKPQCGGPSLTLRLWLMWSGSTDRAQALVPSLFLGLVEHREQGNGMAVQEARGRRPPGVSTLVSCSEEWQCCLD